MSLNLNPDIEARLIALAQSTGVSVETFLLDVVEEKTWHSKPRRLSPEVRRCWGSFPTRPKELLIWQEADVFPMNHAEKEELIDGSIGEGSPFQRSFGHYTHRVDDSTAILPRGWRDRLVPVTGTNTRDVRGWCLEVHDLAIAK